MEERKGYDSYGGFAALYDRLMSDVPYDEWTDRILELLAGAGISEGLCADLACGTGSITRRLADRGFDMIGIDLSGEMLQVAGEREEEQQASRPPVLYLQQDIRSFELYGTVRAMVCACDSINYILETEEVEQVLRLVNNYLDPGGMLVMDFHTPYYFREVLGEETISDIDEDVALIWENEELEDGCHASSLTIFQQLEDGTYSRTDEEHIQRGYTMEEMRRLAENAGLKDVHFYDGYSREAAGPESERIVMTAVECGKTPQQDQ